MRKSFRFLLTIALLICSIVHCIAQFDAYEYRTPIHQASEGWNTMNLPLEIYDNTKTDLSDIRIYALDSPNEESIEQPYFLDIQNSKTEITKADFKIINSTRTGDFNAFTFELSNRIVVNKIHLNFSNLNFDWNLQIEGSMDQNNWSTIASNMRIISLKNKETDFKYTDILIPDSKFNFYKISFNSSKKADLKNATLSKEVNSTSNYHSYPILKSKTDEDSNSKSTIIDLDLGKKLPVSQVEISPNNTNDYYRPIRIEGIVDSFKTEKGWNYRYKTFYKGTVNSFSDNEFKFNTTLIRKLRITIHNFDNQPLTISGYNIKGPNYRLISRFDQGKNLFLVYGNDKAKSPIYDLSFFKDKIPNDINIATLGQTEFFPKDDNKTDPLFKNKWWLWAIMIIVILLLGTFTLKMLREGK